LKEGRKKGVTERGSDDDDDDDDDDEDEDDDDDGGGSATYCPRIHSLFQFKLKPQKKRAAHTYTGARARARRSWSTPANIPPRHFPPPSPGYRSFSSTSRERGPILSERKYQRSQTQVARMGENGKMAGPPPPRIAQRIDQKESSSRKVVRKSEKPLRLFSLVRV